MEVSPLCEYLIAAYEGAVTEYHECHFAEAVVIEPETAFVLQRDSDSSSFPNCSSLKTKTDTQISRSHLAIALQTISSILKSHAGGNNRSKVCMGCDLGPFRSPFMRPISL